MDFGLGNSTNFLPMSPFFVFLLYPLYFIFLPFLPSHHFLLSFTFLLLRAKDMKNRLAFLRRRNESPGSNPAGKLDKSMKSVK